MKLRRKLIKIQRHFDLDAITHIHVINAAGVARLDIRNNRLRACDLGRGRAGDFHLRVLQLVRVNVGLGIHHAVCGDFHVGCLHGHAGGNVLFCAGNRRRNRLIVAFSEIDEAGERCCLDLVDRTVGDELVEQGDVGRLDRGCERFQTHGSDIISQEIVRVTERFVDETDVVRRKVKCTGIGEITVLRVGVAERTQQEGGVHLSGALCLRLEGGRGCAGSQLVVIKVLDVRCFPALQIGKRRGIGERLGVGLLAEQAHEHNGGLCTGGGTVKVVLRCAGSGRAGALEQTDLMQTVSRRSEVCRTCGNHYACCTGNCHSAELKASFHNFLLLTLLLDRTSLYVHYNRVNMKCKRYFFLQKALFSAEVYPSAEGEEEITCICGYAISIPSLS